MIVLIVGKTMVRMLGSIAAIATAFLFVFSFIASTLTSAYRLVPQQQHHGIITSPSHRWSNVLCRPRQFSTENPGQCSTTGKSTSLSLFGSSYGSEDLPNILGINPFEAAFIFGVLYYVFGADTIYEYAREAGRLFSQYAPVVKDLRSVSQSINQSINQLFF